ncbi:MAG: 1-aminocyclopropane-1-carboxylate deaminase [Candidatus Babeliales bacterium]
MSCNGISKAFVLIFLFNFSAIFCNLFDVYPSLSDQIPYISLGNWPTQVKKLEVLSEQLNATIYLKDEGDCGSLDENGFVSFGGNKVRKLEFLLADALAKGYTTVLTYGGFASNHMVATACYAKQLGLQTIGLLFKQNSPPNITRNLLLNLYFGAHIFECPLPRLLNEDEIASFLNEHDFPPAYVIPVGGSNILGVLGIVNAVFELADQISQGVLPEPDLIYVPFGSMGTTAGLLLGIKLAGLKSKVQAIKVTNTEKYNEQNLFALIKDTNEFLYKLDETIPLCISSEIAQWSARIFLLNLFDVSICEEYIGDGYAYATEAGEHAQTLFKDLEHITLDQTYTAKAAAALIHDCEVNKDTNRVILFWNTYCAYEYSDLTQKVDCALLPDSMQEFIIL